MEEENNIFNTENTTPPATPVVGNNDAEMGGVMATSPPCQGGVKESMPVDDGDDWNSKEDSLEKILGEDQTLASQDQRYDAPTTNKGVSDGEFGDEEDDWGRSSEEDDLLEMSTPYMGENLTLNSPHIPNHHTPRILGSRSLLGIVRSGIKIVGTPDQGVDHGGSEYTPCSEEDMMIPRGGSTAQASPPP